MLHYLVLCSHYDNLGQSSLSSNFTVTRLNSSVSPEPFYLIFEIWLLAKTFSQKILQKEKTKYNKVFCYCLVFFIAIPQKKMFLTNWTDTDKVKTDKGKKKVGLVLLSLRVWIYIEGKLKIFYLGTSEV